MLKIVLDTNFLVHAVTFGVDVFSELERILDVKYTVCILDRSLDELEKLINEAKFSEKKASKVALGLIKSKNINIIPTRSNKSVDDLLVALNPKTNAVATQDRELKSRLKKQKIKVFTIRQKKYIIQEN
jgi:rRNA-processing protein FCF1